MTAPAFTIRSATSEDAGAILACLHGAFEPFRRLYTPEAFRDTVLTPATVHRRLATMTVLVAVAEGGEVVGTIGHTLVDGDEAHIRGMAVLPAWQGAGAAQRLLDAVESALRETTCTRISLDTTEPLRRATRFYLRNGFVASGKVADFFGMPLTEYVRTLSRDRRDRAIR